MEMITAEMMESVMMEIIEHRVFNDQCVGPAKGPASGLLRCVVFFAVKLANACKR